MRNKESMLGNVLNKFLEIDENGLGILADLFERLAGKNGSLWLEKLRLCLRGKDDLFDRLVQRVGGIEVVHQLTSGELVAVAPTAPEPTPWTVDDEGNFHFTVTSNGMTPEEWEQHFERRTGLDNLTHTVLRSASETPTNGVVYHIVVCPCRKMFDFDRLTRKIRAAAEEKGWQKPHWEVACLICDMFTKQQLEQMRLRSITAMHEAIEVFDNSQRLLCLYGEGSCSGLSSVYGKPDGEWHSESGCAFVVPEPPQHTHV